MDVIGTGARPGKGPGPGQVMLATHRSYVHFKSHNPTCSTKLGTERQLLKSLRCEGIRVG